jgi:hypothetical protein
MKWPATAVVVALASATLVVSAYAFGTIRGIGQDAQHEKITRGALSCRPGQVAPNIPGRCFQPKTMDQLAGTSNPNLPAFSITKPTTWIAGFSNLLHGGTFGAVGAPDLEGFFGTVQHCLGGDWLRLEGHPYPQTRAQANAALTACHAYLRQNFERGLALANQLVDTTGKIDPQAVSISACNFVDIQTARDGMSGFADQIRQYSEDHPLELPKNFKLSLVLKALSLVDTAFASQQFVRGVRSPADGTAKCQVLGSIGAVLHGIQDFYAHGNWSDRPDSSKPIGIDNPPGLGQNGRPPLMNMLSSSAVITPGLITACFDFLLGECDGRIDHNADLGKDAGTIKVTVTGVLPNPIQAGGAETPRGKVSNNFAAAVLGSERESYYNWVDFSRQLIFRYGAFRGTQMICAITHDDPVKDCVQTEPTTTSQTVPGIIISGNELSFTGDPCHGAGILHVEVTLQGIQAGTPVVLHVSGTGVSQTLDYNASPGQQYTHTFPLGSGGSFSDNIVSIGGKAPPSSGSQVSTVWEC